ncbi:MAG TPA: PilT/PilU family type 4a pilus ATPase [Candidatus Paceibacterota bacterium]
MDYAKDLDSLVDLVMKEGASDLHVSEGRFPVVRIAGELIPLSKHPAFDRSAMEKIIDFILPPAKKELFKKRRGVDFAYVHGSERFRSHIFIQQGRICLAMRAIPKKIRTISELSLPESIEFFARKHSGFFLVVGPTGHGKSTTLASLVEIINQERLEHIVTIEDPIEYIFSPKKSIIDQREIGDDTPDFHEALKDAFREDMDVIMIGEMRDAETMSAAVTAAETGHLVFATLHTNSASSTVDRIIDSFPPAQQNQIRIQLAASLSGIFSQRLIPRVSGGLLPAYELLINNNAISNLIRDKRTHEIDTVVETSSKEGMIDMNRCLVDLIRRGEVSIENAYLYSNNPKTLEKML